MIFPLPQSLNSTIVSIIILSVSKFKNKSLMFQCFMFKVVIDPLEEHMYIMMRIFDFIIKKVNAIKE